MSEYLELGPVPSSEDCEQVGPDCDRSKMMRECQAYMAQLQRKFNPQHAYFSVRSFRHEFGSYREVVVVYEPTNEESIDEAFHIENNAPENWDEAAKLELALMPV